MSQNIDPFDEVTLDDSFVARGAKESTAAERAERAARIAGGNDRLNAAGQIADGSGKPVFHRRRRSTPWIAIGVVGALAILAIALIAR